MQYFFCDVCCGFASFKSPFLSAIAFRSSALSDFVFVVHETTACFDFQKTFCICLLGGLVSHLGGAKFPLHGVGKSTKKSHSHV